MVPFKGSLGGAPFWRLFQLLLKASRFRRDPGLRGPAGCPGILEIGAGLRNGWGFRSFKGLSVRIYQGTIGFWNVSDVGAQG